MAEMPTRSLRLDDATWLELEALAAETERDVSWHMRRAIRTYLNRIKGQAAGVGQAREKATAS